MTDYHSTKKKGLIDALKKEQNENTILAGKLATARKRIAELEADEPIPYTLAGQEVRCQQ